MCKVATSQLMLGYQLAKKLDDARAEMLRAADGIARQRKGPLSKTSLLAIELKLRRAAGEK
jgi:hypothetical protein